MAITSLPKNFALIEFKSSFRMEGRQPPRSHLIIASPSVKDIMTFNYSGAIYSCTPEEHRTYKKDIIEFLRNDNGFYVKVWDGRKIKVRLPNYSDSYQWVALSGMASILSFTVVAYDPCFESETATDTSRYETP